MENIIGIIHRGLGRGVERFLFRGGFFLPGFSRRLLPLPRFITRFRFGTVLTGQTPIITHGAGPCRQALGHTFDAALVAAHVDGAHGLNVLLQAVCADVLILLGGQVLGGDIFPLQNGHVVEGLPRFLVTFRIRKGRSLIGGVFSHDRILCVSGRAAECSRTAARWVSPISQSLQPIDIYAIGKFFKMPWATGRTFTRIDYTIWEATDVTLLTKHKAIVFHWNVKICNLLV